MLTSKWIGIKPVALSFNGDSTFCQRIVGVLGECDVMSLLSFDQGRKSGTIAVKTARGQTLEGLLAVRHALRSVPVTWLFLPLLYLPGAIAFGNRWFRPEPEGPAQPG